MTTRLLAAARAAEAQLTRLHKLVADLLASVGSSPIQWTPVLDELRAAIAEYESAGLSRLAQAVENAPDFEMVRKSDQAIPVSGHVDTGAFAMSIEDRIAVHNAKVVTKVMEMMMEQRTPGLIASHPADISDDAAGDTYLSDAASAPQLASKNPPAGGGVA